MRDLIVSRRSVLAAGAAGALGILLDPSAVLADDDEVDLLRWDLVQIMQGTVLAGGSDLSKDAATGDTVMLTGSGEARPGDHTATGGGTFVHKHASGAEVAHGSYVVTGFNSFVNGHGSLVGIPLTDGIDRKNRTTSGILSLDIAGHPSTGGSISGKLNIECALPGDRSGAEEGFTLDILSFHFRRVPGGGVTIFHVLEE